MPLNRKQELSKDLINEEMKKLLQEEIDKQGFKTNREAAEFFNKLTGNDYTPQRISDWRHGNKFIPRDMIAYLFLLSKEPAKVDPDKDDELEL